MSMRLAERFAIELLAARHDRSRFACGVEALDQYLARQASQDMRRGYATVFVATCKPGPAVVGFYTLSMAGISVGLVPEPLRRKLPRYPTVPAVRLGRLAIDTSARGTGLGKFLLFDALRRSLASDVAWAALLVDAKDEAARSFYLHFGFESLVDDPLHLYLPRAAVEAAFGTPTP